VQLNHNLHHLWFRRKLLLNASGVDINGGESLQIGAGDGRELPADDVNAHHLFFTKANGEGKQHGEVISLKGSRLILSDIVMLESEGMVSLRLGNENQISRLFIDANEKPNAAGIIFWGDRHRVEDVFVTGLSARWKGGLLFRSAEKAHDPSDNISINHVTIMDSPDSISIGTSGKNSLPSGLMFNSIVAVAKTPQDRVLFVNEAVNAFRFTDSFLYGESNVPSPSGVKNVDPLLIPMDDGLYIPDENGPAKGQGSRMTSLPVYENETGPLTYQWNENIPPLGGNCSLDADANGSSDATTDGWLFARYMLGLRGNALTSGVVKNNCIRCTAAEIEPFLAQCETSLASDIDGNGTVDSLIDGLLITRYLLGLRGGSLIGKAVASDCTRCTTAEIKRHLDSLRIQTFRL